MSVPRISVIIPVHNAKSYLRECLDSILSQTEKNIEVLCVDDGSTDGSTEILAGHANADPRIKILTEPCSGAGAARNLGLAHAQGTYLYFMDADDVCEPELLERAADELDTHRAQVVVFESWVYDSERSSNRLATWNLRVDNLPPEKVFPGRDIADKLFLTFGNCPWNKLFLHSFIKENNLRFQEVSRANDLLFTCSALALAERICTIKQPFYHYRTTSSGSLQATKDKDPLAFWTAYAALGSFLRDKGLYEVFHRGYLNHTLDGIVFNADSLKTLQGLRMLKAAVPSLIEPELGVLNLPEDLFDDTAQLNQYQSLCEDPLDEYLFKQMKSQMASKEQLYDYLDWHSWQANKYKGLYSETRQNLDTAQLELSEARSEVERVRSSTSFKVGLALTKPARCIKDTIRCVRGS